MGGPGSGKSTLARRVGQRLGIPVHHLDDLYRDGGGTGPIRTPRERDELVERVIRLHAWVTEGVHLGWTDPFIEDADIVVWLDTVGWGSASRRVARRFIRGGAVGLGRGARVATARGAGSRLLAAAGHVRDLGRSIAESRAYYRSTDGTPGLPETRVATAERLARRDRGLIHCRSDLDVARFLASLS